MTASTQATHVDAGHRDMALDGLRGFALGMVLVGHGLNVPEGSVVRDVYYTLIDSMQIALDLFFILSGYLITSILLRTSGGQGYFRNFYARRVLRVFPAYYMVLAGVFLLRPLVFGAPTWQDDLNDAAPYYLLYIQNMVMASTGEGLGWVGMFHTFSLAIEEQFYLFWPLLIWLVPRRFLLRTCLSLAAASVLYKIGVFASGGAYFTVYMSTFSRLHALAAGAAIAIWLSRGVPKVALPLLRKAGLLAGGALVVVVVVRACGLTSYESHSFLLNLCAVPFFSWLFMEVLGAAPGRPLRRFLEARPLTVLGRYSYGMYLIHAVVLWELRLALLPSWNGAVGATAAMLATGVIGLAVSFAMAVAMYHMLEEPVLKLKRYFEPIPAGSERTRTGSEREANDHDRGP